MNLPADLQRFLPYIVVGVLAVVGLLLVMRGVAPGDGGAADPGRIDPGSEVRPGGDSDRGGSNRDGGSGRTGERRPVKRSPKAYVSCVERATNTAALEKCQPLLRSRSDEHAAATLCARMAAPPSTAILIVNGFDRQSRWGPHDPGDALRFPWISLCLQQIERHTDAGDYRTLVYDQSWLPEHEKILREHDVEVFTDPEGRHMPHARALDLLVDRAEGAEFIVTLDTDAFPVSDGWLDQLTGSLRDGAALAGIYRDEMAPQIRPFIHVAGLCIRRDTLLGLDVSFHREPGQDTGQNITDALTAMGKDLNRLLRSNRRNFHFLIGGLYGDLLYHHGAGSRHAKFWTSEDVDADERVRVALRDVAFENIDHLVAVLRGTQDNDLGLPEVSR